MPTTTIASSTTATTSTASTTQLTFLQLIDSSPFWSSFFADFAAGLLIIVLASWLVPILLSWRELPRVRLIDFKRRKNAFTFSAVDERWEVSLRLIIKNLGKRTLEKYYWEIYTPIEVSFEFPRIDSQPGHATIALEKGERFHRWYGYIELPIFPLDDVDFPFEIKVSTDHKKPVTIYYFFKTEYGQSPFWSWIALVTGYMPLLKKIKIREALPQK